LLQWLQKSLTFLRIRILLKIRWIRSIQTLQTYHWIPKIQWLQ
jgi:hypothetical protein